MTDELTERLRTALVKAGYTDARNGNPSVRAMAKALGLNNSRVSRYMYHGSKMQLDAREQIAEALSMTVAELDSEVEGREVKTYSPPPAANLLDSRERALVNDLINLLADRHREVVAHDADGEASNMRAAGSAAEEDDSTVHEADFSADETDQEYYERRYGRAAAPREEQISHDDPLDEQGI